MKKYPRESYILQTKVVPKASTDDFRTTLEKSFSDLQLTAEGYVDLFSFHGLNIMDHIEWINRPGNGFITILPPSLQPPLLTLVNPPFNPFSTPLQPSLSTHHRPGNGLILFFPSSLSPPYSSTPSFNRLPPIPLQPPLSTHPLDPLN